MLAAGADANACDYDARTALHIAAADGNLSAVKVLVEQGGAELGVKDRCAGAAGTWLGICQQRKSEVCPSVLLRPRPYLCMSA